MLIFIWNLLLTHLIFHFKYCIFGLLYFYALFFSFHLSPFFSPWILFLAILLKVLIIYLCHVCICLCWLTCSLVMGHIFLIITRNFWFDIAYCEYYIVELWILISSLKNIRLTLFWQDIKLYINQLDSFKFFFCYGELAKLFKQG